MKELIYLLLVVLGAVFGFIGRWLYSKFKLTSVEQKVRRLESEAVKEAEAKSKELILETRDQLLKEQQQSEREARERRSELQRSERRILQKEENAERKLAELDTIKNQLEDRKKVIEKTELDLEKRENSVMMELEKIASMTQDEAKDIIIESMQKDAKRDAQSLINKIEQEAQLKADKLARDIVLTSIQRMATEVSGDVSIASVSLPSDEMKGRIIGREGRNIRTLETLTGVDIIIDDTPEAVVISCFDPVRKEIARVSLERLISDGRIHPARIEEVVNKVTKEINQTIVEEGEKVVFDLGLHNIPQEGIKALGRLHYRTSYAQNVLDHSKEVAVIAGMLAAEIGADRDIAKRAALLHDIGKGIESEGDENHAELGASLAKKIGEDPRVINGIISHHNDIEPTSIEAIIVQVADAISASRPGARRETLNNYIKRLENLENIAEDFEGVSKAFAIQAGRELRIMVNNESVSDDDSKILAKDIAKRIEDELRYPGRIKVTIIRETRVTEYAR